jgi:hypothetical protein
MLIAIGCFTQFFTPQERDEAGYGERFRDANRHRPSQIKQDHHDL